MSSPRTPANSACLIRIQRDLEDVANLRDRVQLTFPDPTKLQHFIVRVVPEQGIWRSSKFDFEFVIPDGWPNRRPTVRILTRVWHPNIAEPDDGGGVCLNILRKNYTPITQIQEFIHGLHFLFVEPNALDPLTIEAAQQYKTNYAAFKLKAEEYRSLYCPRDSTVVRFSVKSNGISSSRCLSSGDVEIALPIGKIWKRNRNGAIRNIDRVNRSPLN
jgi:ubiquitin-conjugating enzyme E2 M